ncbi:hypothetical protein Ccrd_020122 [Cynara cardunculus var. scolymus]|uniref:Uncharacterized protein n=1 Tax=Cynara cardunculus var. scolymus TaxID=59895 RepID=A0A124SEZ5_CYNCS|nr:hypothetical protein Ccrd_020122 [Cynara cardunculus var. scolymus]
MCLFILPNQTSNVLSSLSKINTKGSREESYLSFVAEVVAGSAAWLGRGLSCVCAQRREDDSRASFDLTTGQVLS